MAATIEIHLEFSYHAVLPPKEWPRWGGCPKSIDTVQELLRRLHDHHLQATWYILGDIARSTPSLITQLRQSGQRIGSHGYWHRRGERVGDSDDVATRKLLPECVGYRSPYWVSTPRPGMAGGVFFRILPYELLKAEVERYQTLYLHPHDFFPSAGPLRRRLFFCDPWKRLNRLFRDVEFTHD